MVLLDIFNGICFPLDIFHSLFWDNLEKCCNKWWNRKTPIDSPAAPLGGRKFQVGEMWYYESLYYTVVIQKYPELYIYIYLDDIPIVHDIAMISP